MNILTAANIFPSAKYVFIDEFSNYSSEKINF